MALWNCCGGRRLLFIIHFWHTFWAAAFTVDFCFLPLIIQFVCHSVYILIVTSNQPQTGTYLSWFWCLHIPSRCGLTNTQHALICPYGLQAFQKHPVLHPKLKLGSFISLDWISKSNLLWKDFLQCFIITLTSYIWRSAMYITKWGLHPSFEMYKCNHPHIMGRGFK